MNFEAIIGAYVLEVADLTITSEDAIFKKRESYVENDYKKVVENIKGECGKQLSYVKREGNDEEQDDGISTWMRDFNAVCTLQDEMEIDVSLLHISDNLAKDVRCLVREYCPVKNFKSPVEMKLILKDDILVYHSPRRLSYENQKVVAHQIDEWLRQGIIRQSSSEYAAPIVLGSKKDGSKRLCCDNFPMALVDVVVDRLQEAKVLTTWDLRNDYFHVPVNEDSKKFT
ncbi:PREDICTED: uncharacterized protein LOC108361927 [Rhagoletis zephyria]|uniref:uncharacterized protein LOC108361927 n=1 Tax=Rhagoletis zephyria TaxID=28612 RepID=UPI0008118C2B|nr:PREDICTED: uncharacterized protein LOC108361927 [Rhagoletis zephyria]